jgi:hypothetical protein
MNEEQEQALKDWQAGAKGKMGIKGTLEFRDKDGNIVKTVELDGSIPLDRIAKE